MKNLKDLNGSDLLIVSAKGVRGGKVQLTFAQKIENPEVRPQGIAGLLNASDERFEGSLGSPRYAFMSAQPADVQKLFGIDVSDLTEGSSRELGIENPSIQGVKLNIQVTETTNGSDWDNDHIDTRAKRAGKDGDFIMSNGKHIFINTTVVAAEAQHVFLTGTTRQSIEGSSAAYAIAEATGV